jgi:ketosteroid isomerase-like protein
MRRCYAAVNEGVRTGDFRPAIEEFFDPEIVFDLEAIMEGTFQGHDGIQKFFEGQLEFIEDLHTEPREFIEAGDRMLVEILATGRFRHTGLDEVAGEGGVRFFHLWTMRDGKPVHMRLYREDEREKALADAGITEERASSANRRADD